MTDFNTPWELHFDRDGTEDIAVIIDADGNELVTSRNFWLPEAADPVPPTLAAMQIMVTAPKLLNALRELLAETVTLDLKHGIALTEGEMRARDEALYAIAEATGMAEIDAMTSE